MLELFIILHCVYTQCHGMHFLSCSPGNGLLYNETDSLVLPVYHVEQPAINSAKLQSQPHHCVNIENKNWLSLVNNFVEYIFLQKKRSLYSHQEQNGARRNPSITPKQVTSHCFLILHSHC